MHGLSMDRVREEMGRQVFWSPMAYAWYATQMSVTGWTMYLAWVNATLGAAPRQENRE